MMEQPQVRQDSGDFPYRGTLGVLVLGQETRSARCRKLYSMRIEETGFRIRPELIETAKRLAGE